MFDYFKLFCLTTGETKPRESWSLTSLAALHRRRLIVSEWIEFSLRESEANPSRALKLSNNYYGGSNFRVRAVCCTTEPSPRPDEFGGQMYHPPANVAHFVEPHLTQKKLSIFGFLVIWKQAKHLESPVQTKAYVQANLTQNTSGWWVENFHFQKVLPAVHRCGRSNHRLPYTREKYWLMQGRSISISHLHGASVIIVKFDKEAIKYCGNYTSGIVLSSIPFQLCVWAPILSSIPSSTPWDTQNSSINSIRCSPAVGPPRGSVSEICGRIPGATQPLRSRLTTRWKCRRGESPRVHLSPKEGRRSANSTNSSPVPLSRQWTKLRSVRVRIRDRRFAVVI